jgi:hypothetical protein
MEKAKRDPSKRSPAGKAADEQHHSDAACGPCQRCGNVLRVFQGASSAVPAAIRLLRRANIVLKFICKCDDICALCCRVHACTLVACSLLRKKRTQRVDCVVQCVSFPISEFLTICPRLPCAVDSLGRGITLQQHFRGTYLRILRRGMRAITPR